LENDELVVLVVWVDDIIVLGPSLLIEQVQYDLEKEFTCKHKEELTKYMGSKITINCNSNGLDILSSHHRY
jgi:hypothetical protein